MSLYNAYPVDRLPNTTALREYGEPDASMVDNLDKRWGSIIRALHDKRPTWSFGCKFTARYSSAPHVLEVMAHGEELGRIMFDYDRFLIKNFRSQDRIESGRDPFAKTERTLVQRILKDFRPMSPSELYRQTVDDYSSRVFVALRDAGGVFREVTDSRHMALLHAIVKHWDDIEVLRNDPAAKIPADLPEQRQRVTDAERISEHGTYYVEHDSGFITQHHMRPRPINELDEDLRSKLAMLKVAPEDTMIPDVGVRHKNLFRVVGVKDG